METTTLEPISQEQSTQALRWARLAIRPLCIAIHYDVALSQLSEACGPELRKPTTEPQKAVLRSLFESATARHNVAAATFWLKIHCPKLFPNKPTSRNKTPEPRQLNYERKDPSLGFEFDVYINDGEPNYPI